MDRDRLYDIREVCTHKKSGRGDSDRKRPVWQTCEDHKCIRKKHPLRMGKPWREKKHGISGWRKSQLSV